MNDFATDDLWQKRIRDTILAPAFYARYSNQGRYVFIDKGRLASILQKRFAVDTIVQGRSGGAVCVEEKIVRWPGRVYDAMTLETESCTVEGHESPGWMTYGEADYLLYCFESESGGLRCYFIDFPELKKWFWPRESTFPTFQMQQRNRTRGRVVKIASIQAGVKTWAFELQAPIDKLDTP